jgi:hypothetical protein
MAEAAGRCEQADGRSRCIAVISLRWSVNAGQEPRFYAGEDAVLAKGPMCHPLIERADNLNGRISMVEARVVEPVGRMFLCARCRDPVVLCSRCDRGNRYCGDECSTEARSAHGRNAGRRYQAGDIGRSMHAARSRRWRLQRKAKLESRAVDERTVTHHGCTEEPVQLPGMATQSVRLAASSTALDTAVQALPRACPRCAVAVSPFVRQGFMRSRVAAKGQRRVRPPVPPP